MTPRVPSQSRREGRLHELQEAALALILEEGVAAFSVHRLAERVGFTPGALYRYFRSRDELLAAVQLEVLEGFEAFLRAARALGKEEAPLRRLVLLCRAYQSLKQVDPRRFQLISSLVSAPEPLLDDAPAKQALERAMGLLALLADELEQARGEGALDDGEPMRRALVTWSSLQAVLDREKLARLLPEHFDVTALSRELLRALLLGWGADAEALEDALGYGDEMLPRLLVLSVAAPAEPSLRKSRTSQRESRA